MMDTIGFWFGLKIFAAGWGCGILTVFLVGLIALLLGDKRRG